MSGDDTLYCTHHYKRLDPLPECACCLQPVDATKEYVPGCGHAVHVYCLEKWIDHQTSRTKTCPMCRRAFEKAVVLSVRPELKLRDMERHLEHVNVTGHVCWHILTIEFATALTSTLRSIFDADRGELAEWDSKIRPYRLQVLDIVFCIPTGENINVLLELHALLLTLIVFWNEYQKMYGHVKHLLRASTRERFALFQKIDKRMKKESSATPESSTPESSTLVSSALGSSAPETSPTETLNPETESSEPESSDTESSDTESIS
jgi:hypothetical protein